MELLVARNPDAVSTLPYLILVPVAGRRWSGVPGEGHLAPDDGTPRAAVVVEDRYSQVFGQDRVRPALVADGLAELQVRWPTVPLVFCETRKLAEEWTDRYLAEGWPGLATTPR